MNPMGGEGTNLLSILINLAFGFVAGLVLFLGFEEVIAIGSELAEKLISLTGYGQQMAMFGLATNIAPYIVLAPIAGLALKQLASVRSIKGFFFFAAAIAVGIAAAYFGQEYVTSLLA